MPTPPLLRASISLSAYRFAGLSDCLQKLEFLPTGSAAHYVIQHPDPSAPREPLLSQGEEIFGWYAVSTRAGGPA
jgi:hypothetical protein